MYYQLQNKCYPQRCLLAHFEATLDFSQYLNSLRLCYYGQVNSLRVPNGGTIYFAVDGTSHAFERAIISLMFKKVSVTIIVHFNDS